MVAVDEHLERIRTEGSTIVRDVFDPDTQDEIMDYFRTADSDSIEAANQEFDGDYSEEELRLMRLRFMSEVAN